jgi:hypothetical protein
MSPGNSPSARNFSIHSATGSATDEPARGVHAASLSELRMASDYSGRTGASHIEAA